MMKKNVHYAAALNMLGTFHYETGQYEQAAAAYKKLQNIRSVSLVEMQSTRRPAEIFHAPAEN